MSEIDSSSRPARLALALGGGFLVAMSLPPWGFWPLAFIGIIAFEFALGDRPSAAIRFLAGWCFAAAWLGMGTGWMWQLSVPGYLAATTIFGAAHGLAALVSPGGPWRVIARPAAHTLVEAIRFSFPFGGVPLASLGISQVSGPLAGAARVVGVIGITWVVFQLSVALAAIAIATRVDRHRPARISAPYGLAFTGVAVVILASLVAPRGIDTGDTLRIAAVQGGGRQGTSALEVPAWMVTERHLEATELITAADQVDLVLWPENVIRVRDLPFESGPVAAAVAAHAARLGAPFSVGITEDAVLTGRGEPGQVINSQVIVTPAGAVTSRYDKVRRVPFGEYVPLRGLLDALGAPIHQVRTDAVPGTGPAVLELPDGARAATVISWEVFFPGRVREGVLAGGELILNPTNGASYTGTIVQTQQIASSRLRAIETGRWVVQAAPTGFTAVIDASGRVRQRTAVSEQRVLIDTVPLRTGSTWYVRIGEVPIILALTALLGLAVIAGRRRPDQREISDLDHDGHRSVVDELDAHLGAEPAGRDPRPAAPE